MTFIVLRLDTLTAKRYATFAEAAKAAKLLAAQKVRALIVRG
jgi:hypothetical protein